MMELTIDGKVYAFRFGMGFLREIDKTVEVPISGVPGKKENIGLQMAVRYLVGGDVVTLVDVLDIANKTETPRVTKAMLDAYIEDENTDIDKLFDDTLDFLKNANATKKETNKILKEMAEQVTKTEELMAKVEELRQKLK